MGPRVLRANARNVRGGPVDRVEETAGAGARPHGHQTALLLSERRRYLFRQRARRPSWNIRTCRVRLDLEALDSYLSVNYVPGPDTLLAGIRKVRPGHLLEWRHGKTWIEPWWTLPAGDRNRGRSKAPRKQLDGLMHSAVREHLVSDVPLGVWASGGLDSSAVLHYAAHAHNRPAQNIFRIVCGPQLR